jgi:hypothetical protein
VACRIATYHGPVIRYQEKRPTPRTWAVFLAVCATAWLVMWFADDRQWVFPTLLVGMLGGIAGLTLWSTGRYGNVTLTDSELRVGRDRIPLAEIVPASVTGPGEVSPDTPLAGGAYLPVLGTSTIGLVRRDGRPAQIQSRDPEALAAALRSALS